jgi:hypothetical protein
MLLLVSCKKPQASWSDSHPEFSTHYQLMIQAYSGSNVHTAESALLDWEKFVKSCAGEGYNPNPDLIITYYRLYLLNQHIRSASDADQYLQLCMDSTHLWRESIGMTNAITRGELLASMKRADEKLSVDWKGKP